MEIVIIDQTNNEELLKLDSYFERIADRTSRLLERAKDASLSVIFVTPEKIHEINAAYRKIDRPTDVISFAMQDDPSNIYVSEEENELGDIFINVQAIEDQAKEYGHSPLREACFYLPMDCCICLATTIWSRMMKKSCSACRTRS